MFYIHSFYIQETSLWETRIKVTGKLRNFQGCHNFLSKFFVYWKSKKLEDNARNILKSFSSTDFWLENKIFGNNLCVFIIISALLYLLHLLSLHKLLVYPPFLYILHVECSEDVTGEYSSAKYQWCNLGDTLGAIALSSREKLPFL